MRSGFRPALLYTRDGEARRLSAYPIQCKGCGEIGQVAFHGTVTKETIAQALGQADITGNFFVHAGKLACARCQQIFNLDGATAFHVNLNILASVTPPAKKGPFK